MSDRRFQRDVLFEILKRLPLKSFWRLRSVSTEWFSAVSDPEFIRRHDALSNTTDAKILLMDTKAGPSREWLTFVAGRSVPVESEKVLNGSGCSTRLPSRSVGGLVCLGSTDGYDIHVLNPTTREFISIAHPPFPGMTSPSLRYQFCFGFDPVANKHKVLYSYCDPEFPPANATQHWIYTIGGAEEWRRTAADSNYHEKSNYHGEVCVDGVIYFLSLIYDPESVHPRYGLAAFDLRTESFYTVELSIPDLNGASFRLQAYKWSLIQYYGSVALVDNGVADKKNDRPLGDYHPVRINVWTLEDFHKQAWALKVSIQPGRAGSQIIRGKRLRLACALLGGKLLVFAPIEIRPPSIELIYYNVESKYFREKSIYVPDGDAFALSSYSCVVYSDHIETLLPLRGLPRILDRSKEPRSPGHVVSSQLTPTV